MNHHFNLMLIDDYMGDWDLGVVLQTRAAGCPLSAHVARHRDRPIGRPLIDKMICEPAWVVSVARQNYSNDVDSNAVVDSTHSRSLFGPFGLSVMLKACGLAPGVSCLQIHSMRALWAPRVVRSFTTTLTVCGHQRPKSSRTHGSRDKNRRLNPPPIETNELQNRKPQERILPSTQASGREVHPETEVREQLHNRCLESC